MTEDATATVVTGSNGKPRVPAGRGRGIWLAVAGALLAAIAIGCAAATVVWAGDVRDNSAEADDRRDAVAAARDVAVLISSVSAANAKSDTDKVLDRATGEFRAEYLATQQQLVDAVVSSGALSTAEVLDAGIASSDAGSYRVLVALTSTVKDSTTSAGEVRVFRLAATMVDISGDWFVQKLEYVQ